MCSRMPERSRQQRVDLYACRRFPLLFNQFPAPRAYSHFRGPCRNMQMAVKRRRFLTSSHWTSGTAALAVFSFGVWYGLPLPGMHFRERALAWRRLHTSARGPRFTYTLGKQLLFCRFLTP